MLLLKDHLPTTLENIVSIKSTKKNQNLHKAPKFKQSLCDSPLIFVRSDAALYNFLHLRNGYLVETGRLDSLQKKRTKAVNTGQLLDVHISTEAKTK